MTGVLAALDDGGASLALHVGGETLSWAQLRRAGDVLSAPVRPGERVLVQATPTMRTCVAAAGVLRRDAVLVPVDPQAPAADLNYLLADAAPHWVLGAEGQLTRGPGQGSAPEDPDLRLLVYTSGTTGRPKGVQLPAAAIAADLDALAAAWGQGPRDRLVHALPLFHVHGLVLGLLGPLRHGFPLHHPGRFTPQGVDALLAQVPGRGVLFGVPTTYHRMLASGATGSLAGARLLVSGSAPLPAADAAKVLAASGQEPVERYGLTETLILAAARADEPRRRGWVGRPLPGVEIKLVDADPGPSADSGQVWARGATLFLGYRGRGPAPLVDGWFATGDAASVDATGALRILGRLGSDLIKTGGFKVGAGEVEDVLAGHDWVREVAVAGRPDPDLGEVVVAWVVLEPNAGPDPGGQLRAWAAERLARHKAPRRVVVVAQLPRTALGKIRKTALPDSVG